MAAKHKIQSRCKLDKIETMLKPQVQPARGQRWRHKRTGLEGEVVMITDLDRITVEIPDELGCMTWRSTVRMFRERWSYVGESR